MYLSLYNSLTKVYGVNRIITKKDFFTKISRHYLVPKPLRPLVLREMEKMKLLECNDNNEIQIMSYEINLHKEVKKFYRDMGLFR